MDYTGSMRTFFSFILFIALFSAAAAYSDGLAVSIYTSASAENFGRAADRSRKTTILLSEFKNAESLPAGREGMQTAVMVESRVKTALESIMKGNDSVVVENSVIAVVNDSNRDIYRFSWEEYGFDIEFSLEGPSPELLDLIERTYSDDAYIAGEVRRSYTDNYAVRVYKAENIIRPKENVLDFRDALISATVIGSTFQPLLGMHNGLGVLDEIGLHSARLDVLDDDEIVDYRDYASNSDELLSFIHLVEEMPGDFIDNLYTTFGNITDRINEDNSIQLPEQLYETRKGDNTDFALFYYDVLRRKGYDVKFVVIDSGDRDAELYSTVFFKEKGTVLWGRIDSYELEREKADRWGRLPALVFDASVNYFEPEVDELMSKGKIVLPPPSDWQTSLY
jgi:hypothetical protein